MLIFRLLTALYFIGLISSFYLPFTALYQIVFLASTTVLYTGIAGWGSYQIRSQLYLKSFNQNKAAKNQVAITFDDGPDVLNTPQILKLLSAYNAKVTFFMIGSKVSNNVDLVRQVQEEGHLIGNHTFGHRNCFPLLSSHKIRLEVEQTQNEIKKATGTVPLYFRPPFGVTNPLIAKALKKLPLKTIGWSIRSLDTQIKEKQKIVDKILGQVKGGDIILLHDTTPDISWIVEELLKQFKNDNLQAVTVEELLFSK